MPVDRFKKNKISFPCGVLSVLSAGAVMYSLARTSTSRLDNDSKSDDYMPLTVHYIAAFGHIAATAYYLYMISRQSDLQDTYAKQP